MNKVNPKSDTWPADAMDERRNQQLDRQLHTYGGLGGRFHDANGDWLNFASNDYLDLARAPGLKAAAIQATEQYGTGATASRLVTGTLPLHTALEERVARHKGYPRALVFGSGYLTNAGVIPAMVGRTDHVFADRLVHASMIDAVKLSGARLHRFAHNEPGALAPLLARFTDGRRLILTESVFSMDGDLSPLSELAELAEQHGAYLMVDEAHAGGVFGPKGSGRVRELDLSARVHLTMGTLSKALGGYGGYVACSEPLHEWLINSARAFIYTTAPPPSIMATALAAFDVLEAEPNRGTELLERAAYFRKALQAAGLDTMHSESQIIPVLVGDNGVVMRMAKALRSRGILVGAMRPPTVPPGRARLRLSVTLAHSRADLDSAVEAIRTVFDEAGAP